MHTTITQNPWLFAKHSPSKTLTIKRKERAKPKESFTHGQAHLYRVNFELIESTVSPLITWRAKSINADWLRQQTFSLIFPKCIII